MRRAGFILNHATNVYYYGNEPVIGHTVVIEMLCDDAFTRFIETEIAKG